VDLHAVVEDMKYCNTLSIN